MAENSSFFQMISFRRLTTKIGLTNPYNSENFKPISVTKLDLSDLPKTTPPIIETEQKDSLKDLKQSLVQVLEVQNLSRVQILNNLDPSYTIDRIA
jgi:hypothetical protein